MELLKANKFSTTTAIAVGSNTNSAEYIMDPDTSFQYVTSGLADDTTIGSITVSFDETTTISRIGMLGINLRGFNLFYDGVTANTFAITSTGATSTSQWTSNSETAMYLEVAAVQCTSVTLDMKTTIVANSEKAIGYFVASEERLTFPQIPAAKNYKPRRFSKEIMHQLSDGSMRIQSVATKHSADITLEYITTAFRNDLKTVFDLHEGMIFVPFGTTPLCMAISL
jgi:hypothetical protein